jgi:hypothetical protein
MHPVRCFLAITGSKKQLPAKLSGRRPLVASLSLAERFMNGLQGKIVIYGYRDGGWENLPGKEDSGYETAKLARGCNLYFIAASYTGGSDGIKLDENMGKANPCSRVITFDFYIANPYCVLGPLYYTKAAASLETTSEKKIKGINVNNSYLDHDKFELKTTEKKELNHVRKFLADNPKAFVALQGFCNNSGTPGYKMELSRNRAE